MTIRRGALIVVLAACANAGDKTVDNRVDAAPAGDSGGGDVTRQCPQEQLAIDVSASGQVTCAAYDEVVRGALAASCTIYLGWRDDCNGCTTAPAKWGSAGTTCAVGAGADNRCTTPSLGGATVALLGLNLDGDMDGNDKLYGGMHCTVPEATASVAPCKPGEFITGKYGSSWTCSSLADVAASYARDSCVLYLGWQDNCDGCTRAPAKWGRAGPSGCQNGVGADNTCTVANLGGVMVNLFGLNPDGDVDDNDKLHAGLSCAAPAPETSMQMMACPPGQFVSATAADGSFTCASPAAAYADYFTQMCSLYYGWRDNCSGCTTPPAKWGRATASSCTLGVGANDTCNRFTLGAEVDLFGLNPDGDVDGNDTLYVGLRCE